MEARTFNEDEKKALKQLLSLLDYEWQDTKLFSKSVMWQTLRWDEPMEAGGGDIKFMWLQVQMPNDCSWYTIPVADPSGNSDRPLFPSEVLPPVPGLEVCDLQRAVAFLPSTIITLGGSYRRNDIRRPVLKEDDFGIGAKWIDVSKLGQKWQDLPQMKAPRDFPSGVVVDGKIYVFGGMRRPSGDFFVERFDLLSGWTEWETIRYGEDMPLLFEHIPGGLFTDRDGHKHLLFRSDPHRRVGSLTALYTFDLETGAIDLAETPFPDLRHGAVVVDGLLYAYLEHTQDIRAYDLGQQIWIPGGVHGLEIEPDAMLRLVHIGGKRLCAIYDDYVIGRETGDEHFWVPNHCTIRFIVTEFEVEKNNDGGLEAKIFSSRSFNIPDGLVLRDCLILPGKPGCATA